MLHKIQEAFEAGLADMREGQGAALVIRQRGVLLCQNCSDSWLPNTLVPVFSATKAAASACLLLALWEKNLSPQTPVGEIWSKFPLPKATVAQLLSHQCGLAAWEHSAPIDDLEACRQAVEDSEPLWVPPQHGYHPQTFGPIIDILMLRLCGMLISDYWEKNIRAPRKLDFYIGHVPEEAYSRIAPLHAPRIPAGGLPKDEFFRQYYTPGTLVYRAFHSVSGLESVREMNTPAAWQSGSPAKGGVASADGLAQFYQVLMNCCPEVCRWMSVPQASGRDKVLQRETAFSCGAMCAPTELFAGLPGAFGHAGAGGSHAFCCPSLGLSFAYVTNRMEPGVLPGKRVRRILQALEF